MSHLYDKSHGDRIMKNKKSNNHYNELMQNIAGINNQLKRNGVNIAFNFHG